MKTANIVASSRRSTRRLGFQSTGLEATPVFPMLPDSLSPCIEDDRTIRKSEQWQETKAKTGVVSKLATKAREKGLSLFEYLADLAPEDGGGSRFLSP